MNFTEEIRKDILSKPHESACCEYAMLSGYLHAALTLVRGGSGYGFEVQTESEELADYTTDTVRKLFGAEPEICYVKENSMHSKNRIFIRYGYLDAEAILCELGFLSRENHLTPLFGLPAEIVENDCCKRAYVMGAFLGAGNAALPEAAGGSATGYHLQFLFSGKEYALSFSELLSAYGIVPKMTERKNGYMVYFRNSQEISDLLTVCGASRCALLLQERLVEKSFKNQLVRSVNCENANIGKTVNAYVSAKIAIEAIGLENLPPALQTVAKIRLENPEASLSEMAETSGISKSCLNHRLRKIMEISRNLSGSGNLDD